MITKAVDDLKLRSTEAYHNINILKLESPIATLCLRCWLQRLFTFSDVTFNSLSFREMCLRKPIQLTGKLNSLVFGGPASAYLLVVINIIDCSNKISEWFGIIF